MKVRDLLSKPLVTIGRNDRVSVADERMSTNRIRHLPVLDDEGELAGIVSRRDVTREALRRTLGYGEAAQDKLLGTLLVKEVMTNAVETIEADVALAEAAARMLDRRIGSLVVVEQGRPIGILTEGDFVRHAAGRGARRS